MGNSLVGVWHVGECMGKILVCIGYVSSFTLYWFSLFDWLPGFKGFIGKVVYPPFLLWGALV